ncbi:MAG TPA: alpha-amylase family glycosyl hydrolase, partial [Thermomicrobiales bacterium]|nr:alpha-amylase family glycosyl hydrolase [Thermomicrobiales bacterium]
HGRGWYLHSFYPEQPDLDWRNPAVADAFGGALRFWLARGVDGFRVDAIDRMLKDPARRDDPPRTGPPPLPELGGAAQLEPRHSRDAPDIGTALAQLRAAAGATVLVGEAYLPAARLGPYLEHLDTCFSFDLLHAAWEPEALRAAVAGARAAGRLAWVLSNHDFARLPDRVGERNVRAAALLLLTLPGPVFVYQGDEIGMPDGPGRPGVPDDRAGRDPHRHPMCWDATPQGGFSRGAPWLPALRPPGGSVAEQEADPGSLLHLYRDLIALRRTLADDFAPVPDAAAGVVAFRRGGRLVALNAGAEPCPAPRAGALLRHTHGAGAVPATLAPGEGFLAEAP